jgi:hypothetical protein
LTKVEYEALLDEIDRTKGEFLRDLNKAVGSTFEFVNDFNRTKNLPLLQMDDQAISMIPECAKEWVEMLKCQVDPSISSDVTQMTDGTRTSNHEQSSVETSPNLPDVDMVTDKDARDEIVEILRTTEVSMGDAIYTDPGSASAPHFFDDAALGVLLSPFEFSGDER